MQQFYTEQLHKEDDPKIGQAEPETVNSAVPTMDVVEPSETPDDDKSRQLGDWSVYKFYFNTIGAPATIIFMVLAVGWAVLTAFPGNNFPEHISHPRDANTGKSFG